MKLHLTISIPNWLDRIFAWPVLVYRKRKFGQPYRKIRLTEGKVAIVDQKDFYWLNNFDWFTKRNNKSFYAVRLDNDCAKWPTMVSMHRELMNSPEGFFVDHRNTDTLDNRSSNLRLATRSQNQWNRRKTKNTSSHFMGVSFYKRLGNWTACINVAKKRIFLGYFDSEIDAARAYDQAAMKYHGEFARLNFPQDLAGACPPKL
jgi:hypothetical protein